MIKIAAVKEHRYRGKLRTPGEVYEVDGRSDARLVKALGWGIDAPAEVPVEALVKQPAAAAPIKLGVTPPRTALTPWATRVSAEALVPIGTEDNDQAAETRPKRAYKRRDLTAEGSSE